MDCWSLGRAKRCGQGDFELTARTVIRATCTGQGHSLQHAPASQVGLGPGTCVSDLTQIEEGRSTVERTRSAVGSKSTHPCRFVCLLFYWENHNRQLLSNYRVPKILPECATKEKEMSGERRSGGDGSTIRCWCRGMPTTTNLTCTPTSSLLTIQEWSSCVIGEIGRIGQSTPTRIMPSSARKRDDRQKWAWPACRVQQRRVGCNCFSGRIRSTKRRVHFF